MLIRYFYSNYRDGNPLKKKGLDCKDLYEAGCRNLQVDDCTWGMLVDENYWASRHDGANVKIKG